MNQFKNKKTIFSILTLGFLALSSVPAHAISLTEGDYFQLTVAPEDLGKVEVNFTAFDPIEQEVLDKTVTLEKNEDVFLSNVLPDDFTPMTFNFDIQKTAQGVIIDIPNNNFLVEINFTFESDLGLSLIIPSTVIITAPSDILVELKDSQGLIIDTLETGDAPVSYDKLTPKNGMLFQIASCGNGRTESSEECDDGNSDDNDFCSNACETIVPVCGDSLIQGDEECDDGNNTDTDACSNTCLNPSLEDNEGGCSLNSSASNSSSNLFVAASALFLAAFFAAKRRFSSR